MMRSWGELVRGYLESADALRLIFLLLDARRTPGEQDRQMHDWTRAAGIDERVVLTKSDKLSNNAARRRAARRSPPSSQIDPTNAHRRSPRSRRKESNEVRREIASRL